MILAGIVPEVTRLQMPGPTRTGLPITLRELAGLNTQITAKRIEINPHVYYTAIITICYWLLH